MGWFPIHMPVFTSSCFLCELRSKGSGPWACPGARQGLVLIVLCQSQKGGPWSYRAPCPKAGSRRLHSAQGSFPSVPLPMEWVEPELGETTLLPSAAALETLRWPVMPDQQAAGPDAPRRSSPRARQGPELPCTAQGGADLPRWAGTRGSRCMWPCPNAGVTHSPAPGGVRRGTLCAARPNCGLALGLPPLVAGEWA